MGYEIYAVHRGATRRGQNKSLKMVFNKAFKILENYIFNLITLHLVFV